MAVTGEVLRVLLIAGCYVHVSYAMSSSLSACLHTKYRGNGRGLVRQGNRRDRREVQPTR